MAAKTMLRMRELERATGVGRETIRYYIREGLLPQPERRGRNVALYDESFVARIGLIKDLQRTRFLPLQLIKAVLDSGALPSAEQTDALMRLDGRVFAAAREPAVWARTSDVAARTGASAADIRALADAGAIAPIVRDGEEVLGPEDAEIVECWAAMRAAGYSDDLGFSPANLRVHSGMVDVLVQEELRMFTRGTAREVDAEASARMAEAGVEQVGRIVALMRRKKILDAIAEAGAAGTGYRRSGSRRA
jgi:DNA-binding transcriptional MerR regulator